MLKSNTKRLLLLALMFLGFGLFSVTRLTAVTSCEVLSQELSQFASQEAAYQGDVNQNTLVYSDSFKNLYEQLILLEGKSVNDLSWALGNVAGLKESINKLANQLFEKAELNGEQASNWTSQVENCFGVRGVQHLEQWAELDYEILTTVASFYSLSAQQTEAWVQDWRALEKNKSLVPPETFSDVNKASNDFRETVQLNTQLFTNSKDAFEKISNN